MQPAEQPNLDEHEESCPKCEGSDIIFAELDYRGCRDCSHWWEYGDTTE